MNTPEEISDHELMLAVRDGDTERLGELFERHHRPLFGFFVRQTRNTTASEDLVQQVFYRILKYRHTYRDEGAFRAWAYQLARRALADHYRKTSGSPSTLDEPEQINEVADQRPHAAAEAERSDHLSLLNQAISLMPEEQRELLTLHRFQQLSHEELAGMHGCSTGAMKVRVHRALNSLKEIFFRLQTSPGQAS